MASHMNDFAVCSKARDSWR